MRTLGLFLGWLCLTAALHAQDTTGTVTRVADGNTIQIQTADARKSVLIKLIGLDAPRKASRDREGQEPWGTRAQQYLSLAITRKSVRIETDVVRQGPDGAIWGYVWLGDQLLNEDLLRQGHAVLDTRPPNVKYVERLQKAASEARQANRGIWDPKEPLPEPPSQFSADKATVEAKRQGTEQSLALAAFEIGCIIGNKKTKKYHVPGGRYYETAKMSEHAIYFRTKEDAEKSGYTAASK